MLIVGLNYAPEPTGNAPYTTALAEGLLGMGHAVSVVTGYPHYPDWKASKRYRGLRDTEVANGVPVKRVRHTVPRSHRLFPRLLMEITFGLHAAFVRWNTCDVVLVVSPALFGSAFAIAKAALFRTPVVIWVQDLYSRGIEEISGKRGWIWRLVRALESRIMRACDGVTVIHERFRDYVVQDLGVPNSKVAVIPNWTHITPSEKFDREAVRQRFAWASNEIIALHAGNMGMKQGLENVIEAARVADRSSSMVRFVLLGDGNRRRALEEIATGVVRLDFMRPLEDAEYVDALRSADVLLLNEAEGLREMSVPSKLTSYFAVGQPIVAATHPSSAASGELSRSGGGWRVNPGDPEALLQAVERLGTNSLAAEKMGKQGKVYARTLLRETGAVTAHSHWLSNIPGAEPASRQ